MNLQGLAQIVCKINICQMNEWINMEDTDLRGWTALKIIRFWKDISTWPDGRPIICLDIWRVWSKVWISEVEGNKPAFSKLHLSVPVLGIVIGSKGPEVSQGAADYTFNSACLSLRYPRPQQRGGHMWCKKTLVEPLVGLVVPLCVLLSPGLLLRPLKTVIMFHLPVPTFSFSSTPWVLFIWGPASVS